VIDTPPLAQSEAIEAARLADLVLIPCKPNAFDLHAVRLTASMAKSSAKPAFVVFNEGPPNAPNIYAQASELVERFGLAVAPVRLSDRADFRVATNSGQVAQEIEPTGRAAEEVAELWSWLEIQLKMKTGNKHYAKTAGA